MTEAERTITTPEETPDAASHEGPRQASPAAAGRGAEPAGDPDVATGAGGAAGAAAADGDAGSDSGSAGDGGTAADSTADPVAGGAHAEDGPARRRPRVPILIGVAVLAYLLDLLSKFWVVHSLENHDDVDVLGHYLRFGVIRNSGAAFSIGQGMTVVFTVIAVAVIVVIARLSRRLYSAPWAVALGLLLGGAFGNLTDRVFRAPGSFRGHVVDFIHPEHFAVFNLADSAITCGGVLIVLLSFRGVEPDGTRHRD